MSSATKGAGDNPRSDPSTAASQPSGAAADATDPSVDLAAATFPVGMNRAMLIADTKLPGRRHDEARNRLRQTQGPAGLED
jgi:hypothetical protein